MPDIRRNACVLEHERIGSATIETSLNFIKDGKRTVATCELSCFEQVIGIDRDHTALALDRLHHDGGDLTGVLPPNIAQRIDIVRRNSDEAFRKRLERLLLIGLCRSGERCERTTVEASFKHEDDVTTRRLFLRPETCELDRAFVSLRPGVREEGLPRGTEERGYAFVSHLRNELGHFATLLDIEVVAHMDELLGLLGDGFRHTRVTMPQAVNPDTREQIEVFLTLFVLYGNALTFNEADGLALEGVHDIRII